MSETVKIWMKEFISEKKDIDEEIRQTKGTIDNEELWKRGSKDKEEADIHQDNINELKEYLEWLEDRKENYDV
jgi:hypothetical protein